MRTGNYVDPDAGKITVGEWIDQWLAALGHLKESSRVRTVGVVENHVRPRWGTTPLVGRHARRRCSAGSPTSAPTLSARSVRKVHGTLMQLLAWAVQGRPDRAEPGRGDPAAPPAADRSPVPRLTPTVAMLAKECGDYAPLVRFLAYTGLRWGEVAALRIRRVDLVRRRASTSPSRSPRSTAARCGARRRPTPGAPFRSPASSLASSRRWVEGRRPGRPGLPAPRGGVLRVRKFRRNVFDPAVRRVGPAGFHPHELRHTAASLAIASGADVKVVQLMLGHKTATMTLDLYGHLFPDRLDELADRFDDAVCAPDVNQGPTADDEEDDQ